MNSYLIQYGKYGWGTVLEARSEEDAVNSLLKGGYTHVGINDLQYDFNVSEVGLASAYVVDSQLKVKKK
jgi:hypothetical protein